MRRIIYSLFLLLSYNGNSYGSAGIFQDYVAASVNGGSASFLAGGANADGAALFQSSDYGSLNSLIVGGEIKSFKNNGTDVTSASLFYRVYLTGGSPGSFIALSLPYDSDLGPPGDQKWLSNPDVGGGIEIAAGLAPGDYTLEVFWEITTNGVDAPAVITENNGGSNYTATFTREAVAPVILSSFSGIQERNEIQLNWEVEAEINNDYFELYRSNDNSTWTSIGRVSGKFGRAKSDRQYRFWDSNPVIGKNLYELRQYDLDGTESNLDKIEVSYDYQLSNIPNLITDQLIIPTNLSASLYNLSGQLVWNNKSQSSDVTTLRSGIYVLTISDGEKNNYSYRIIKQ